VDKSRKIIQTFDIIN